MDTATIKLWSNYNMATNLILDAMGGASNIVGEFAEQLVADYYGGKQLQASSKSADVILDDGRTIQVKARTPRQTLTTSLGIIRTWDFDLLVAVLFSTDGAVIKAVEVASDVAQSIATPNKLQNGWVITTTQDFLNHPKVRDITQGLNDVLAGVRSKAEGSQARMIPERPSPAKSYVPIFPAVTNNPAPIRRAVAGNSLNQFKQWMEREGFPKSTISNRASNCMKVQRFEGSLDTHYQNDRCRSLLERMEYQPRQQQQHNIPIDGDVKNGMSTLRSAVRLYASFKNGETNVRGERRSSWY